MGSPSSSATAVRDGVVDAGEVGAAPHCADDRGAPPRCKLSRHRADAAEHAMDEDRRAFDRPVPEDGAMGGDAGMPRHAPISSLTLPGSATAWSAGTTVSCAAVPKGR